MSESNNEK